MNAFPKGRAVMPSFNSSRLGARFGLFALVTLFALLLSSVTSAQTTVSTGSITGTVTDPVDAVVSGAKVSIINKGKGQVIALSTNASGLYASGALIPGDYVVRVEAKGFKTTEVPIIVQVNVTSNGNVKLQVGEMSQIVEVQGTAIAVNTQQA